MTITGPYRGMGSFILLWSGQAGSMLGSGITRFTFVFFAFRETGSATAVTLVALCAFLPRMLLSPIAGNLVDRLGDRLGLIIPDIGSALGMITALVLAVQGNLSFTAILVVASAVGAAEATQYPALSATVARMVEEDQYARADGLVSAARSGSDIGGPVIAGLLLVFPAGLQLAIAVDAVLSCVAVAVVLLIRIPARTRRESKQSTFWSDTTFGVRWIFSNPGLCRLAGLFFVVNLVGVLGQIIIQPMVLARSGGDATDLSLVLGAIGLGGVVGGLLMAAWGGPVDKIRGLLIGIMAVSAIGQMAFGASDSLWMWCVTGFMNGALVAIINACNQAVWQTNVPEAILGRVFGGFVFIAQLSVPLAIAFAGPAADHILEPWAQSDGSLARAWAGIVGEEPGTGMSALLVCAGLLGFLMALAGLISKPLRALHSPALDARPVPADS